MYVTLNFVIKILISTFNKAIPKGTSPLTDGKLLLAFQVSRDKITLVVYTRTQIGCTALVLYCTHGTNIKSYRD